MHSDEPHTLMIGAGLDVIGAKHVQYRSHPEQCESLARFDLLAESKQCARLPHFSNSDLKLRVSSHCAPSSTEHRCAAPTYSTIHHDPGVVHMSGGEKQAGLGTANSPSRARGEQTTLLSSCPATGQEKEGEGQIIALKQRGAGQKWHATQPVTSPQTTHCRPEV